MSTGLLDTSEKQSYPVPELQIITSEDGFKELKQEWDELWSQIPNTAVFQSFSYCWYSWIYIAKPAKRSLFCIILRNQKKLAGIWPMVIHRKAGCMIVRPLGPCAAEYSDPLIQVDNWTIENLKLMMAVLHRKSGCDVINIPFLKNHSPLYEVVMGENPWNVDPDIAPYVRWQENTTWDEYCSGLRKSYRQAQSKKWRRLARLGEIKFEIVEDKADFSFIIDWLIDEKRKWGERVNKKGDWVVHNQYKRCMLALLYDDTAASKPILYTLKVNGKIIAAKLACVNKYHIDWLITGFHSDYSKFSPGILLAEHCLRWAFDRHLNCDFGAGREENKLFWSNNAYNDVSSIQIVNSVRGRIAAEMWRMLRSLSNRHKKYKDDRKLKQKAITNQSVDSSS